MQSEERRDGWARYLAEEEERGRQAARDFPFRLVETTGERAFATWREIKEQGDGAPFVLGHGGDLYRIADRMAYRREWGETPEKVIEAAARIRFPDDLLRLRTEDYARAEEFWRREREKGEAVWFDPDEGWPPTGAWPKEPYAEEPVCTASQWNIERDPDTRKPERIPLDHVYIAVLPGADSAEAPAHFLWGGWNDVPRSEFLVAALRSWHARYGAELVGISHDTWSLRIERRPRSRREAMALAREMVALCEDLLSEVRTLQGQAALVMANDWWNFWWD